MGVPSGARMPPCVERMRNSAPPIADGSQPMPAFCVQPKTSPEGRDAQHLGGQRQRAHGAGHVRRDVKE